MDRVKYPSGSETKFEDLVDNIQTKAFSNLKKRVEHIIGSYGLNLTVNNGTISGTDFAVTTTVAGATVSVSPGTALTASANYFKTEGSITTANLANSTVNSGYAVVLTYSESGSNPVKAVNAFVFDKLGSQSLNRNTIFSDSVTVELQAIATDISSLSLSENQVLIAAI